MSHSERCPVCFGTGKVKISDNGQIIGGSFPDSKQCHGCAGKGWVLVNDVPTYNPHFDYTCTCGNTAIHYCPVHNCFNCSCVFSNQLENQGG